MSNHEHSNRKRLDTCSVPIAAFLAAVVLCFSQAVAHDVHTFGEYSQGQFGPRGDCYKHRLCIDVELAQPSKCNLIANTTLQAPTSDGEFYHFGVKLEMDGYDISMEQPCVLYEPPVADSEIHATCNYTSQRPHKLPAASLEVCLVITPKNTRFDIPPTGCILGPEGEPQPAYWWDDRGLVKHESSITMACYDQDD